MTKYTLVRSQRRTIAIHITQDGHVVVRAPKKCPLSQIEQFVNEKDLWVRTKQQEILQQKAKSTFLRASLPELTQEDYKILRKKASQIISAHTAAYAEQMQLTYEKITIRDQKSRWGSCSTKGNLNFNWRLILAPGEVLDYVVIHELTHRKHMNHSAEFWHEVARWCPDYKEQRQWLKKNGDLLMHM